MEHFKTKFQKELKEIKERYSERVTSGSLTSLQDYGRNCGVLYGVQEVEDLFNDLWDSYVREE